MALYPMYQDALTHSLYGKCKLPIFVMDKHMQFNYPLHYHNFAELSLVVSGSGTETVNGVPHRFRRGTVTFLLPHHIHEIRLDRPNVHKFNCMFDIHILFLNPADRELANSLLKTGNELPSHYDLNEEQTIYMAGLFETMKREYENHHFAKESVLHSKLLEAFVFLVRLFRSSGDGVSVPDMRESKSNVIQLLHYLHLHYQEEITLTMLAQKFKWNASYISRIFKQEVGHTFTDYLHALRVGRAASLLATTAMSVVDIAVEVGFDHARTLTRVFKEFHGVTPTEYRNLHRKRLPS
jgi:AraC-like DNA-binding protein